MADFRRLQAITMDAASDTSLSSAFQVQGEFSHFALEVPSTSGWCVTSTCNIRLMGSQSETGTYYNVGYSNNPATSTSGFSLWEVPQSAALGGIVISEGFQFVKWGKLQFTSTATAATDFILYGRKFD